MDDEELLNWLIVMEECMQMLYVNFQHLPQERLKDRLMDTRDVINDILKRLP